MFVTVQLSILILGNPFLKKVFSKPFPKTFHYIWALGIEVRAGREMLNAPKHTKPITNKSISFLLSFLKKATLNSFLLNNYTFF